MGFAMTPTQRRQFAENPTVNPLTGRKITVGKSVHNTLMKSYETPRSARNNNSLIKAYLPPLARTTKGKHAEPAVQQFAHDNTAHFVIEGKGRVDYMVISEQNDGRYGVDLVLLGKSETLRDWVHRTYGYRTTVFAMPNDKVTLEHLWCLLERSAETSERANTGTISMALDRIYDLLGGNVPTKCRLKTAPKERKPKKTVRFANDARIADTKTFARNATRTDESIFLVNCRVKMPPQDESQVGKKRDTTLVWVGVLLPDGSSVLVPPKDTPLLPILMYDQFPKGFKFGKFVTKYSEWWMVQEALSVLKSINTRGLSIDKRQAFKNAELHLENSKF